MIAFEFPDFPHLPLFGVLSWVHLSVSITEASPYLKGHCYLLEKLWALFDQGGKAAFAVCNQSVKLQVVFLFDLCQRVGNDPSTGLQTVGK